MNNLQKAKRLKFLLEKIEKIKSIYQEIDDLSCELYKASSNIIKIDKTSSIEIKDNFASENKIFRTTCVKRFEAKILKRKLK